MQQNSVAFQLVRPDAAMRARLDPIFGGVHRAIRVAHQLGPRLRWTGAALRDGFRTPGPGIKQVFIAHRFLLNPLAGIWERSGRRDIGPTARLCSTRDAARAARRCSARRDWANMALRSMPERESCDDQTGWYRPCAVEGDR